MSKSSRYVRRSYTHDAEVPAIKAHASLCGEVVWAWNALHYSFANLFTRIATPHNPMMGSAIWAALGADRAQRDILKAAVRSLSWRENRAERRILWAIERASRLNEYRNYVVHLHFGFRIGAKGTKTRPSYFANSEFKVAKLAQSDIHALMRTLIGDLLQLGEYVRVVSNELVSGAPRTSARKPLLRTLRSPKERTPRPVRKRGAARRRAQRPASPE